MQQDRQDTGLSGTNEEIVPNFRVFRGDGSYGDPFTKNATGEQSVFYVAVSIMSGLFTNMERAIHMMLEAEKAYADPVIPMVYVCGDTLQKITEPLLHQEDKVEKTIAKARKKWFTNYTAGVEAIARQGAESNHIVAYWDQFIVHPDYKKIREFLDLLLSSQQVEQTDLERVFSSPVEYDEFLDDIKRLQADVAPMIRENALYFAQKNQKLLSEQLAITRNKEDMYYASQKNFYNTANLLCQELKTRGVVGVEEASPPVKKTEEEIVQAQKKEILNATYRYLVQEFAVFLFWASNTNLGHIQSKFNLTSSTTLPDQIVTPVLVYPISASDNAANTFNAYVKVEQLYRKYATQLHLPVIGQPLTIVDSLLPAPLRSARAIKTEVIESDGSDKVSPSSLNVHSANHLLSNANGMTIFSSKSEAAVTPEEDIEHITTSIFSLVKAQIHLPGNKDRVLYQNGITCEISIKKDKESPEFAVYGCEIKQEELGAIRSLISASVALAFHQGRDQTHFTYRGYEYSLVSMPTSAYVHEQLRSEKRISNPEPLLNRYALRK